LEFGGCCGGWDGVDMCGGGMYRCGVDGRLLRIEQIALDDLKQKILSEIIISSNLYTE
jgi:hypothetical protein